MSGVFQDIDPPPPFHRPASAFGAGEDTLAGWRGGWGVNILEDARHSSELYLCKYFVGGGGQFRELQWNHADNDKRSLFLFAKCLKMFRFLRISAQSMPTNI
jgi:hypothetical protein